VEDQFYVRIRGRVQGPYDTAKLQSLVRRGQLSRMHEVSTDRSLWRQAADFPELFATPTVAQGAARTYQQGGTHDGELELEAPASPGGEWFYALNQEQKGPVSFEQLKGLLQAGVITGSSLVWREGMSEWSPAEVVPNLRQFISFGRGTSGPEGDGGDSLDKDSLRTLKETIPWVSFLVVCVITTCVLMLFLGIVAVLLGVRDRETQLTAGGLFLLLYACVGLWGGVLLNGYNSNVRKFLSGRSPEVLESALKSLKSFWTYISIIVIIVLVNLGAIAIWVFSAGVSLT
jgi:hypothetical protein